MNFIKLFYNDGTEAGTGGGAQVADVVDTPVASSTATPSTPNPVIPENAFTIEEMKQFGFDSREKMIEALNGLKQNQKSEEEKRKEANIEKARFLQFAAENDLINDDFNKYESLQLKTERDLVFERFAAEEKADNPDITEAELKEAFEEEYKLNSENAKAKAKGEARLKKEASEIKNPAESAWNSAHKEYQESLKAYNKKQEFDSLLKETFKDAIPDKLPFKVKNGEEEIVVEIPIDAKLKTKIQQSFDSEKSLTKYLLHEGKPEDFAGSLRTKINSFLKAELADIAVQNAIDTGIKLGTKKGSNVGAENLFGLQQGGAGQAAAKVVDLETSNKAIAEARKKYVTHR